MGTTIGHPAETAQQLDALRLQRSVVQVVTSPAAAHLRIRQASPLWARQVTQPNLEEGRFIEPGDRVAALESTRDPWGAHAREGHVPPCLEDLFSQLAPRLAAATDEHLPRRKGLRVRVVL